VVAPFDFDDNGWRGIMVRASDLGYVLARTRLFLCRSDRAPDRMMAEVSSAAEFRGFAFHIAARGYLRERRIPMSFDGRRSLGGEVITGPQRAQLVADRLMTLFRRIA